MRDKQRETEIVRERNRDRQRQSETQRERDRETETERETATERERERGRGRGRGRVRRRHTERRVTYRNSAQEPHPGLRVWKVMLTANTMDPHISQYSSVQRTGAVATSVSAGAA